MEELSKSQKAKRAIRKFKTLSDALLLRGSYKPTGKTGRTLIDALKEISPEIYGTMSNPRIVELKGLEYVFDRMPRGIEGCQKIILTAQEDFQETAFEEIIPLKRRRISYAISKSELCFVITRGASEIYDIMTHLTFLVIESEKIFNQICNKEGEIRQEWKQLEEYVKNGIELSGSKLDKAIWNLSIILGRTYKETKETYEYLQKTHLDKNANSGLFNIIHTIGNLKLKENEKKAQGLTIQFTPSLQDAIGHHKYASLWANNIKRNLQTLNLIDRPIHIISANMHSVKNILYCSGALKQEGETISKNLYDMIIENREAIDIKPYALENGYFFLEDNSGSNIDVQIIDTMLIKQESFHSDSDFDNDYIQKEMPVIVVMDYAFGTQAFELMDELLGPCKLDECEVHVHIKSISVMGKAGILPGRKGDIMLASAHVMEGSAHNYIVNNDLSEEDFDDEVDCYTGPIVTVLGTSLQNTAVLERFHKSNWKAVGIEMEGGHYQRAIRAATIQGHIAADVKTRYAYYASDNPLKSGETLASGPMGDEGIVPTYKITNTILQKILNP